MQRYIPDAAWMYGGVMLPKMKGDFLGKLIVLEAGSGDSQHSEI